MNSAPPPTAEHHIHTRKPAEAIRDIALWKKKGLSVMLLLAATGTYVLLEVYRFNFVTLVSWAGMLVVSLLFLWGNIHRLVGKEVRDMGGGTGMMIREESAMETGNMVRELIEESIRWMFRLGAEGELFGFGTTVCLLWLISFVASRVDALTFLYCGFVVGMIVPVIYVKYDGKIKEYGRRIKMQSQRCLEGTEVKLQKLKSKVAGFDGDHLKQKKAL